MHKPDKSKGRELYGLSVSLNSGKEICVSTVLLVDPGYFVLVAEVVDADQFFFRSFFYQGKEGFFPGFQCVCRNIWCKYRMAGADGFKDLQTKRGTAHDEKWSSAYGENQKTESGEIYYGTVLEHILLENLCAFYDVGEHNEMKLHGADWNDAMDMAWDNGESVAFTCAYAGNMNNIADCLEKLERISGINRVEIASEMECLFSCGRDLYENADKKRKLLGSYTKKCAHNISGDTVIVRIDEIVRNLREKADWMMENIRKTI